MHLSPEQVDRLSMWQFNAAIIGWAKQYADPDKISSAEEDEIWEWMQAKDNIPLSSGRFKSLNGKQH